MKHVTLLTFENALASSVVGAMEVFYLADFFLARHQKRQDGQKIIRHLNFPSTLGASAKAFK